MSKEVKRFLTVCMIVALSIGVTACKGGEQPATDSLTSSTQSSASDSSIESSEEIVPEKDSQALAVEDLIKRFPAEMDITLADADAIKQAETAFTGLTEEQKAQVNNYDKLFSAVQKIVFLSNVRVAESAIASLPNADEITLAEEGAYAEVYALVQGLSEEEKFALAGYSKLLSVHERINSLKKIQQVEQLIALLPAHEEIDESYLPVLEEAETAFEALTESEKLEVENAEFLVQSRPAITASYWQDAKVRKHYVEGRNLAFKVNLKQNTVSSLTCGGNVISANDYTYADGVLTIKESLLAQLGVGMYAFKLTDSRDTNFNFLVGIGYEEKSTVYFDFDVTEYTAPATYGVPCQTIENGIDGKSGRFTKSTSLANVFGFFKGGEFGFVDYTFKTGKVYLLEFDVKILNDTQDAWWMPIYFGGKGDVAYLYENYSLVFPQVNTLYSEGGIEMRDGYAHVKAIFLATAETTNLEFANWGGGVDILLDNILLTALPETAIAQVRDQIASLPDQVASADKTAVQTVKAAYDGLSLAEKQVVDNFAKLNDLLSQLASLEQADAVVEMIKALPEKEDFISEHYEAVYAAKAAYDNLTVQAQACVTNYEKLNVLLQSIGESYWNEAGFEFYVPADQSFSVQVELLENGITAVMLNGRVMDSTAYSYANGILNFGEYFIGKDRDVYTISLTDGKGKSFTFFLYWGIEKGSAVYYDFEYYTYQNTDGAAVPSSAYENGIQGVSQRFQKPSAAATIFGFFKDGKYGFAPYTFCSGKTYTLSFDIKVLDGTADNWWMPIFFSGGKGDLVYVKQNNGEVYLQTYSVDSLNAKNRQSVVDNGDGSYRVTVTFTLKEGELYEGMEFSNFDGAVDILLDNVLLIEE